MPRQRGLVYQLERFPPELMRQVKARAALEGRPVRDVVLALLREYANFEAPPKALSGPPVIDRSHTSSDPNGLDF